MLKLTKPYKIFKNHSTNTSLTRARADQCTGSCHAVHSVGNRKYKNIVYPALKTPKSRDAISRSRWRKTRFTHHLSLCLS